MRVKRYKKFQRYMNFFEKHFHFKEPFQILVDGTFANAALATKVNMREQLPKYLDGQCKLLTTPCVIIETEQLGPSLYGAVRVLKEVQLLKCQHSEKPIPAASCLKSVVCKNVPKKSATCDASTDPVDHFIMATQDPNLRLNFREIIGVPLLYLHGNAPTMEKPSEASVKWSVKRDRKKLEVSGYQKEILQHIKEDVLASSSGSTRKGTKKRKRAGPNPLSCKKSKRVSAEHDVHNNVSQGNSQQAEKKKRKRIKTKIPKHVRELTSKSHA